MYTKFTKYIFNDFGGVGQTTQKFNRRNRNKNSLVYTISLQKYLQFWRCRPNKRHVSLADRLMDGQHLTIIQLEHTISKNGHVKNKYMYIKGRETNNNGVKITNIERLVNYITITIYKAYVHVCCVHTRSKQSHVHVHMNWSH